MDMVSGSLAALVCISKEAEKAEFSPNSLAVLPLRPGPGEDFPVGGPNCACTETKLRTKHEIRERNFFIVLIWVKTCPSLYQTSRAPCKLQVSSPARGRLKPNFEFLG